MSLNLIDSIIDNDLFEIYISLEIYFLFLNIWRFKVALIIYTFKNLWPILNDLNIYFVLSQVFSIDIAQIKNTMCNQGTIGYIY
jgi:hypothetical protein